MGGQPWWADKHQSTASRQSKLSKKGQTPARTLRVKSRRTEGHWEMETSHRSLKCVSIERQGVTDTEGYQCGLRKGDMKSGIACQPSAGNAEGRGNDPRYALHRLGKESGKRYWRDATWVSLVSRDLMKKETLSLKARFKDHFFAKGSSQLGGEDSSTHLYFIPVLILALQFWFYLNLNPDNGSAWDKRLIFTTTIKFYPQKLTHFSLKELLEGFPNKNFSKFHVSVAPQRKPETIALATQYILKKKENITLRINSVSTNVFYLFSSKLLDTVN